MHRPDYPQLLIASDHSLLVRFGTEIDLSLHQSVRRLTHSLLSEKPRWFTNIHPAYASVLVTFDPRITELPEIRRRISRHLEQLHSVELPQPRCVEVPVVYGGEFGPDLRDVASHCRLSVEEVIQMHVSDHYLVYFLGFSPGFAYMGGLSPLLATPRLAAPRTRVPAGSVAIGGKQTGIYPVVSPGGWRIIGRTPLGLFDPKRDPPTHLQIGDEVMFRQISEEEFRSFFSSPDRSDRSELT